jgi:hypothetical protein
MIFVCKTTDYVMKRYLSLIGVLFFCMILPGKTLGQDSSQNQEIGFRTYNMSNFGFFYKKQKSENTYSRLRLATGEFGISKLDPFSGSISLGIAGGLEKRRALSEKLDFITGFELMCTLGSSLTGDNLSLSLTPGIGAVLGVAYMASDKFIVGVETIPTASFKFGYANEDIRISNLKIQFASSYASLFVVYRFSK